MNAMNFYFYRLPGKDEITGYKSGEVNDDADAAGFHIHPFDRGNHDRVVIPPSIRAEASELGTLAKSALESQGGEPSFFPAMSTTRSEHAAMIEAAKAKIQEKNLYKCVLARVIVNEGKINIGATFENLCQSYPQAFVFCFYTPETGLWMGASPELLLKKEGDLLETMALAGTMPADCTDDWDQKNRDEQGIVSDYIMEVFREQRLSPSRTDTNTVTAGPVKHLHTLINGRIEKGDVTTGQALADSLSPTPALNGFPKLTAMLFIGENENHDRAYYGGYVGEKFANSDFNYYVNLRSMLLTEDKFCLYSGSGIMEESDAEAEWDETERKAMTLLDKIIKEKNPNTRN